MMKKLFFLLFVVAAWSVSAYAQSPLMFWTKNTGYGNIDIYVNGKYEGTITRAYSSAPGCGASGCVTVIIHGSHNTWSAKAEDGSEWTSDRAQLTSSKCNTIQLYGTPNYRKPKSATSSKSSESSATPSSSSGNSSGGDALAAAAAVVVVGVAAAAVAAGVIFGANDLYVHRATSQNYSGFNFGMKNSMSRRLDAEIGAGAYSANDVLKTPSGYLRTDHVYNSNPTIWSMDVNFVYNLLPRRMMIKPYVGVGTSLLFSMLGEKTVFGFGGIAGLSAGLWHDRLQLHARYKWLNDFNHSMVAASQIEFGLSVKYKRGWGFAKQRFQDPEYSYRYRDPESPSGGIQAGFVTSPVSATLDGNPLPIESCGGFSLKLCMAIPVSTSSSWGINMGLGMNSLGWKIYDYRQNLYYLHMPLNAYYQIDIPGIPVSILPSAGLHIGMRFFTNEQYEYGYPSDLKLEDDFNRFDIGPSFGAALRIDHTLEIGAQYDLGLINVFHQDEESHYAGVKLYNRGLQLFTRLYF
jgi:hypothetical protein